jgi:etoposide-induced 2.4 mRNA
MVHLCLLFSLYSFEYKWFNQGLELHKRLTYVENNWPYFLGFGAPLAVLTNMSESVVVSGCVFSILFPLFIVSGNQAQVAMDSGAAPLHIFHPTIAISNAIFAKTFSKEKAVSVRQQPSPTTAARTATRSKPTISFANSSVSNQSRL